MLCSLATKAGAMAGRRGALSGSGKVAWVDAPWGGGLGGGGGEGRSVHATAYCPRHVDPLPSACLPCLSFNLCCVDKGPRQGVHAQVHSYTPTGKGRVLRGARLSTGTGMGSGEGSRKQLTVASQVVGAVVVVVGMTAYVVHHYDQDEIKRLKDKAATEMARIQDKAATEIAQAKAEVARIESERKLGERMWENQVVRYKKDVQLAITQDYEPYQAAVLRGGEKSGGTGGSQKE